MLLPLHVYCGISLYVNNYLRFIQSISREIMAIEETLYHLFKKVKKNN